MGEAITHEEDQDKRYSKFKAYDELDKDKFYIFKVHKIVKRLNERMKFKRSLDVGCADGSFSSKLMRDFGFEAHGIDISKKAVELACKKGVKAKVQNLEKQLHFESNYFDLIIATEIIEHIYDTDFLISELKRVLKKNGVLIMTTPNLVSLANRIRIFFGLYPYFVPEYKIGGAGHMRAYTIPILAKQLEEHGFRVIEKKSPNFMFPMTSKSVPNFLKNFAIKLGDVFPKLGSHMIIVAQKN